MDASIVVALIAFTGTAIVAFFTWRASKRATAVSDRTEDRAWVQDIKKDALDARKDLAAAGKEIEALRQQVRTLSHQMDAMARETDYWISQYQLVHRTAWRAGMTLDRLKQLIGPDAPPTPATNH